MRQSFPEAYKRSGGNGKVKLDPSNKDQSNKDRSETDLASLKIKCMT